MGEELIVDPTLEEEQVMAARVTVAVNQRGRICNIHKAGAGTLSVNSLQDVATVPPPPNCNLIN